ncbi:glycosyltransferase family 4 protein [Halomonas sp. M4R1S46]|uniref:glycosyltransferase family 4 protein n=1 Tax=Halomonas sp. M4R1S46 TaxID=2982692 RepID=UPI0021E3B942|nr:glycosyltransferase family 4 protein [Halomonas sp. M4R1S46]UYG06023.1 glycosyltransferase family 4 protein [Halomonas sp. M4R1S46]
MTAVRILLLGFYYPPDISAGAFRCEALVHALARRLPSGSELEVITTQPNRFGREGRWRADDDVWSEGNVTITRVEVSGGGRGMASQARAFASYAARVRQLTRDRHFDLVIATSSRLMTAVLGRWVARRCGARLYQDIRDNFVDNLPSVLPHGTGHLLAPVFGGLERWALARADRINLVSRGFEPYFRSRYPGQRFSWHTNGIDTPFVAALESGVFQQEEASGRCDRPLQVLYAGNLGAGQGMEHILPALAQRLQGRVAFRVIGAGAGREPLRRALAERDVDNVRVLAPVSRVGLLDAYRQADVLFLHLNRLPSLESVLPSKLFEYAATGRPVWAGVSGFAARFVEQEIDNAACFSPCDVDEAVAALGRLEVSSRPRPTFVARWRRDRIIDEMADEIMALVMDEA